MKKIKQLLLLTLFALISFAVTAQTTISGKITDDENGEALIGATITIVGTTLGTTTNIDGNYTLKVPDDAKAVRISYIGYTDQEIDLDGNTNLDIALKSGLNLNEVVVSASKREEKVTDAVASVSVLSKERLEVVPVNSDASEIIRNIPGVNIVKQGTQFSNIELRGAASVNESNTLVLRDYAPLTNMGNKRLNTSNQAISALDMARVEVVRGPAGALYGPNVTSGVVHFISKDPFRYTGTDVMLGIGEQNVFQSAIRHAGNIDNKFGYKVLASYVKSEDFALDTADFTNANGGAVLRPGSNFVDLNGNNVVEDLQNLNQDLYAWNVEGTLEYRFSDKASAAYVGSLSRQRENFRNQTSHNFSGRQAHQHQIRLTYDNLFVSFFHRNSMGNTDKDGNLRENLADHLWIFGYGTPPNGEGAVNDSPQGDEIYTEFAAQYNLDIGDNVDVVLGAEYRNVPSKNSLRQYGINNEQFGGSNAYSLYGGYASVKYELTEKLSLNAAARVDNYESYNQTAFSPRIGGVYKLNKNSSIRANFSRAYAAESRLRTHLDFTIPQPPVRPETHVVGVGDQVTFDDPVTQFAFGQVQGGESFELSNIISALATTAGLDVDVSGVSGTVSPGITGAIFAGHTIGRPTGALNGISATGQGAATLRTVNQIEVGYAGIVNDKIALNADFYYNITQNLQPAGLIPISPGAQLDNEAVAGSIRSALSATDAMIVDSLIATLNTPPPSAGGSPAAPAGWGLILSDRAQANDYLFDTGFPTFGKENVQYFGFDLGGTYYVNTALSAFANYSYISQVVWQAEDLGEQNPNFQYFLNSPPHRINFGASYLKPKGIYGRLAGNFQSEYEGKQGDGRIFTGINQARTIFDASLGYRLDLDVAKLDLGVTVNNLFDTEYKQFVHLPVIRRLAMLNLKASF